jgi:purine nucleoside permease
VPKDIRRIALGENHPEFAQSLNNLATLHYSTERYEDAKHLLQQAMNITRAAFGENHPQYVTFRTRYAVLCEKRGEPFEDDGWTAKL